MSGKDVLGEFEHHVLLALLRIGPEAYTAAILSEIEDRTGREVSAAAVYIALRRLEKNGLVESELRSGRVPGQRHERRYFAVTGAGLAMVREARRRLTRLWEDLDAVLGEG
jgi:DNA-binding PadR family transcriptional regulator